MRMWLVNPTWMCNHHLTREHNDIHQLAEDIERGKNLQELIQNDRIDPPKMYVRHSDVSKELLRRRLDGQSPLKIVNLSAFYAPHANIDAQKNKAELINFCPVCRSNYLHWVKSLAAAGIKEE